MLAYTIVTNNYLAYAKSLKESFLKNNPNDTFFIGLLDAPLKNETLDGVVLAQDLGIDELEQMSQKYSPFELSCAMKPFFAEYFLKEKKAELLVYLDADILVYGGFEYLKNVQNQYHIFLTPHILKHEKSNLMQKIILPSGIYNAGFFALTNHAQSFLFLEWWKEKLKKYCYNNTKSGEFVDQIWLNYVPIFFENTHIIQNEGYNVAYWNIEERKISVENDVLKVNEKFELVFFHFSGYELNNGHNLSKYGNPDMNFEKYANTKHLFEGYDENLKKYNHDFYKNIKSIFGVEKKNLYTKNLLKAIKGDIKITNTKKKKSYFSILWKAIKGETLNY